MVEQAEQQATEKINDIKTEQWAVIERLKAEKREIEARVSWKLLITVPDFTLSTFNNYFYTVH